MDMPDYFLALNKQYGLALNDGQAREHIKAVTEAWFLTLNQNKQEQLASTLPAYLIPKQRLFFSRIHPTVRVNQSELVFDRLALQLQKTDRAEVEQVISGYFKSLKVILSNEQKFQLSKLMDVRMQSLFVRV